MIVCHCSFTAACIQRGRFRSITDAVNGKDTVALFLGIGPLCGFIQRMGGITDFLLHVPIQQRPFVLRQVRTPVFALGGISRCANCTIAALALQGLRLLTGRLHGLRQLALGGLGLFLLGPGQLGDQSADSVPDLLQQRPVIPVLLNEIVQRRLVVYHASGSVRRHLVHGLLIGEVHALGGIAVHAGLDAVGLLLGHDVPEAPVLRGGQLLHPVGHLVSN